MGAYLLPRTFLPPFNEGTLLVNVVYNPGISLAEFEPTRNHRGKTRPRNSRGQEYRPSHGPRRTRRTRRGSSQYRGRRRSAPIEALQGGDLRRHPHQALDAARGRLAGAAHRPSPRPHAVGHSRAGRAQNLRQRSRYPADARRADARTLAGRGWRRRSADRKAGSDPAAQGDARLRARGALWHHAGGRHRGTGRTVWRPRRLTDRRGQPALRRGHAAVRPGPLDDGPGGSADLDAQGLSPPAAARQSGRGRRPQSDPARKWTAPDRRLGQRRRQTRHGGDRRRRAPHHRRVAAAERLRHQPRRHLQGAGGSSIRDRPSVAGVAWR